VSKLDFAGLSSALLAHATRICIDLLPGGRIEGREYVCASISGGRGKSFKVNLITGVWADFANSVYAGGDLISLYAANRGISMGDAYRALADQYNHIDTSVQRLPSPTVEHQCRVAPADVPDPSLHYHKYGAPSMSWVYRDANGGRFFFIARYDTDDGKQFVPWTYRDGRWTPKAWTHPRPIYRIDALTTHADRHVLICEGEKSADAAQSIVGDSYVCTTWAGGSRAVATADWSILRGRNVLIWGDADEPGRIAVDTLIGILQRSGVNEIKTINTHGMPQGWDAADSGFSTAEFFAWAQPRIQVVGDTTPIVATEPEPIPQDTPAPAGIEIDPVAVSGSTHVLWSRLGLITINSGSPVSNADNVRRIIDGTPNLRGHIWADTFYCDIFTDYDGPARQWTDRDTTLLTSLVQRQFGCANFSRQTVSDGIATVAAFDRRNAPQEWIRGLEWDGVERLSTWLHTYMGAEDNEFTRAAGRNWFVGVAARILRPGCQMDNQIILKSGQGGGVRHLRGKSSALRTIGGSWYTTAGSNLLSSKFYETIKGKIIVEIGELVAYTRADIESIKDVMTTCSDRYRVPYGTRAEDNPRTCVFAATTNDDTPLRDHTGNRRFWCVDVGVTHTIDVAAIERDRDQLFAEAAKKYFQWENTRSDEDGWWLMPESETAENEEKNRECDPWEDIISEWLIGREETTAVEVLEQCIDVPDERITMALQSRAARCLKSLGWHKKTGRRNGRLCKFWVRELFPTVTDVTTSDDFNF